MIDHLSISVRDFDAMAPYYARVLKTLGYRRGLEFPDALQLICGRAAGSEVWIAAAAGGRVPSPIHIAWLAASAAEVQAFYEAALEGGTDNGAPGPRDYHPGYYACFVHDPEGNNIEAVIHDYQG